MQATVVIDLATLGELKDMMGADFIAELIDEFIRETGDLVARLPSELAAGDVTAFTRTAHSIKSSSASLGALNFSALARELEMMGKTGDLSTAGPKVAQLAADFIQVKARLVELRNDG